MSHSDTSSAPEIGALLEALRADVRAHRLAQPSPTEDALGRDLGRALDEIELSRIVSAHWPLLGHNLPTRAVALVNKLVRRYLRWYINPIVEQQNAYNDAVARTLRLLADAYADLAAQTTDDRRPTTDDQEAQSAERRAQSEGREDKRTRRQEDKRTTDNGQRTTDHRQQTTDHGQLTTDNGQQTIRTRAAEEPPARFPDLELRAQELQLQLRQTVLAHWPLPARTAPEKLIALVNKLVRRYLRWYINPLVEQQNAANAAITAALLSFVRLDAERRAGAAARRARGR